MRRLIPLMALALTAACDGEANTDWRPDAAIARGDVVNVYGRISNPGALSAFSASVGEHRAAIVRIVEYDAERNPILTTAEYDGQQIRWARGSVDDGDGSWRTTTDCAGMENRSGAVADTYVLTGCGGAEMELAVVPYRAMPQRIETENYAAELTLLPVAAEENINEFATAYDIVMRNLGGQTLECGSAYSIEKQEAGTWVPVNLKNNAFTADLHQLAEGEEYLISFRFEQLKSSPQPGRYRVVKQAASKSISRPSSASRPKSKSRPRVS
ncbi:immunoglobulin-like domain-containing protein [Cohnella sp. JJ-181]|uniref:immunoglobulin-like domain-containing protein n=1 Tax=Cohnella rhizoplanae TaxID=2974897 RepID=UPI0023306095|nr:immunoglobulin-like domain-containing protein [Cohnella sp. JJ-181]